MPRIQLSVNVSDLDAAAVAFYTRLFGTPPAKLRPGYANFAIAEPPLKLVLNSPGNGPGGTSRLWGVRAPDRYGRSMIFTAALGMETHPARSRASR